MVNFRYTEMRDTPSLVSAHGGHSGQFCCHAQDSLDQIVARYVQKGFSWIGITEHMPPVDDIWLYPEERDAGMNALALQRRFDSYFQEVRSLKERYKSQIEIFVGFETESYSGSMQYIWDLLCKEQIDYFVGSLHHVADIAFDHAPEVYKAAVNSLGGIEELYCRYFDEQYDLIRSLQPAVVGHFDIIRCFDPDYKTRLKTPLIWEKLDRNLSLIKKLDLILDVNLKGFDKLGREQFPTFDILVRAIELGIALVPGDDSHGTQSVGRHWDKLIPLLTELGANFNWRKPVQ